MFIVYAIHNRTHDKIYIGQTCDLELRLTQHNEHTFTGYTSRFSGAWTLVYKETCANRTEALHREKQLKQFRGRAFIRKHIPR